MSFKNCDYLWMENICMHPVQAGGSVQHEYCEAHCLFRTIGGQVSHSSPYVVHNNGNDCKHIGPKRRCCNRLYICRLHGNCVTELPETDGVKCCSTCDTFESTGPSIVKTPKYI